MPVARHLLVASLSLFAAAAGAAQTHYALSLIHILVTELMGQGVSGVTGDYSRGASGFWVENDEIQYPVSEITIAGNLKEMWRNICLLYTSRCV